MRINGAALTAIRERTGVTQADLSRTTGIAKETISRLESGARPGTSAQIKAIAEALAVPLTAIMTKAPISPDDERWLTEPVIGGHATAVLACADCGLEFAPDRLRDLGRHVQKRHDRKIRTSERTPRSRRAVA